MARPADGVPPVVRAIVLAAGASRRFGSDKLLAELDGRPILQHVLDRLAAAGLDDPIVVIAPDHSRLRDRVAWGHAIRVVNPRPTDGLASSVRVGWRAAFGADPTPDAVLIVLGDQPLVSPRLCRTLAGAPLDPGRPLLAPRYAGGGGRNPVRAEPAAEPMVMAATGDRGLGPVLEARPDLVRTIEHAGTNPDVDLPADLARLARHARASDGAIPDGAARERGVDPA